MDALAYLDALQASGIRPGLGRIRAMLRSLHHPERAYRSIIVAGTNGKGSTSATFASILNESGYRAGHYTSPHLVDIRERWTIGGALIEPELLQRSVELLREAAERVSITPTYFEALTIVAFVAFELAQCEVAVLEVGMGGRLDATNVVRPLAAVITPIGFDHMEYLGNTLHKIASEKAGVIHRGAIVLTSNDDPLIVNVLRKRAEKFGNPFFEVHDEHDTPLAGAFQRRNVGLAVRTAHELRAQLPRITEESIERGVERTRWRGRLEHLRIGDKDIWIDGCHNPHAIGAVIPYIDERIPRPRQLVFGMMSDKDVAIAARMLFPLFDSIIATEPFPPRSAPAESLVEIATQLGIDAVAEPKPFNAFLRATQSRDRAIFVGGSLYLAGAAIEYFDAQRDRGSE
ncbi:MAG TPA: folylpolyglutamate synthase/dihydrofolate synthase family protein [Thermoanaerobaculia bacterium]|nr:folylpolyglutamate synthase/dihydrofolate synthase family protein [Thermoanaerobaculia bacterium]